jgi:hypothetical protein
VIKGSCLCGAIGFEVDAPGIALALGCYCVNCRKVSGGEGGVYLQVRRDSFRWLCGEDLVQTFESSPGNKRGFCCVCGCVAPVETFYGAVRVPGGALDADPGVPLSINLFTGSKAAWCDLARAPQAFEDGGPPEFWRTAMAKLHAPA